MNVAILYDAIEHAEVKAGDLVAGVPLFLHSLKQFYFHPCVDYVVMVWNEMDIDNHAAQYIEQWKEMYGLMKPFWQFCSTDNLQYVLSKLEQKEKKKPDLILFHNIRYPCVTNGMIYMVAQNAAIHGLAVTAGNIDENTISTSENKRIEENFRYMKYPVAMVSGHRLRKEIGRTAGMLELFSGENPYLCNADERNPVACWSDDIEYIEAVMLVKQDCRQKRM